MKSLSVVIRNTVYGNEPSEQTETLLGYDEDFMYAAGRLYYCDISELRAVSYKREIPVLPAYSNRTVILKYSYTFNL